MITRKLIIVAFVCTLPVLFIPVTFRSFLINLVSSVSFIFPGRIIVLTFLLALLVAILFFLHPCLSRDSKHPYGCEFDCTVSSTFFKGMGCEPNAQPPTWNTKISLSLSLCLETRSWPVRIVKPCQYLRYRLDTPDIIYSHSPRHHENAETPSGGGLHNIVSRNF
jgi:hypothetical protein